MGGSDGQGGCLASIFQHISCNDGVVGAVGSGLYSYAPEGCSWCLLQPGSQCRCHEDLRAAVIATSPNEICCCMYTYIIILILVPLSGSISSESNRRSSDNTTHAQSILTVDACWAACLETCESRGCGWDAVFKAAGARVSEKWPFGGMRPSI